MEETLKKKEEVEQNVIKKEEFDKRYEAFK